MFVAAVFLVNVLVTAFALDLEGAKERPCFEVNKTVPIDIGFASSSNEWYYPAMSRLDLYYTALEVSPKKADDLQESELYYQSCLKFDMSPGSFGVVGFGGNHAQYKFNQQNHTHDVQFTHFKAKSGRIGDAFLTLTDNSTFYFVTTCYSDNQMTWAVSSLTKALPKKTITKIYEHAESLGFSQKYFTGLQYDFCK